MCGGGDMTEQAQALAARAKQLLPLAALYLGSWQDGCTALPEAAAAAVRKSPADPAAELLPQLLRICRTRAPERPEPSALPESDPLHDLQAILKLPAGSRCNLAMRLCDVPEADAAAARGLSEAEYAQKTEKALRQLKFLANGETPSIEAMSAAAKGLPWDPALDAALLAAATVSDKPKNNAEQEPILGEIRKISRQDMRGKKTVSVPLWGVLLGTGCVLAAFAGLLILALRKPHPPQIQEEPTHAEFEPEEIRTFQGYLTIAEAQAKAADAAGQPESALLFLSTKMKPDEMPPSYEMEFYDENGTGYIYVIDAKTGEVLSTNTAAGEPVLHAADWKPAAEMRQAALRCAALHDALFLKEKLSVSGGIGEYKYELPDGNGVVYSMHFNAKNGMLMKYSAEEPVTKQPANLISPEAAKQQALMRAGNPDPEQVIFTKVKQDGGVYLIAFTLDDGTQYLMELNAETGAVNTVDVNPVSADTTDAIGLIAAKERAESMAGLQKGMPVEYTKAKIERGNGVYVYELEFETPDYEYEITVHTTTGAVLKYRAWER